MVERVHRHRRLDCQWTDAHINELAYDGEDWADTDLTSTTKAQAAVASSAIACTTSGGSDPRVYYLDPMPHLRELAYDGEAWHDTDLTTTVG